MTIRILLRRSKAEGQEFSLDVQRAGCAAFAAARGFKGKVTEYVSDGIAGDDVEGLRALRKLVDEVKPGDVVIARDHSRLGRDMLESAASIRSIVEERRGLLYYYSSGEQVQWRGAVDAATNLLRGFAAQSELENIRSRTREAIRDRVKAGRIGGGRCYGYDLRRITDGGKAYTVALVNPTQAEIIRRVFAMYIDGSGLKAIAIKLNNEGVPSPVAGRRGSGSWSPGQIRDILRRERYLGIYVHGLNDRVKKNGRRAKRQGDPSQVIRIEVPEWRIVDDLTWQRAQALAVKRAPTQHSDARAVHPLSGIAKCSECGGAIGVVDYRVKQGVRVATYGCQRARSRGASVCSMSVVRPVPDVDAALADAIRVACERPDVVDAIMSALRAEVEAQAMEAAQVDVEGLQTELMEVRREQRNLMRLAAQLDEDDPEVIREIKIRRERATQIERALSTATRAPAEAAAMIASAEHAVREQLAELRGALASEPSATRDLYRAIFGSGGLTVERHPTAKPARLLIRGAIDLVERMVTPTGIEPVFSA